MQEYKPFIKKAKQDEVAGLVTFMANLWLSG